MVEAVEAAVEEAVEAVEAAVAEDGSRQHAELPVRLTPLSTLSAGWPDAASLGSEIAASIHGVVARPDERLKRPGPMCPALPGVLRANALVAGLVPRECYTRPHSIDAVLLEVALTVLAHSSELACALLAFPDIRLWEIRNYVEFAVERARPSLVEIGAMTGSFHPLQTRPSRYNPSFQSMRAPVPLVGIRRLFPFDRPSLLGDSRALLAFDSRGEDNRPHRMDVTH